NIGPSLPRLDALAFFTPVQPTAFPPTLTGIPDQIVPQNGSVTVPFTIGGAIIASALHVSLTSSNTTLLPVSPSGLSATCNSSGACTLRITPADGRGGTAIITVSVSDGTFTTTSSFMVTVTASASVPGPPMAPQATQDGGGFTASWRPPVIGGPPTLYEIQAGSAMGQSDVVSATTPATIFGTAVGPGNYWIRTRAASGGA